jgi:hypothetical protein
MESKPISKNQRPGRKGIPAGSKDAPTEGDDAGPSDDLHRNYIKQTVIEYRQQAVRQYRYAKKLAGSSKELAENTARSAIESAAHAFWWAEDTEMAEDQHILMHQIGRWVRKTFGCYFTYENSEYKSKCYLSIAHKKIGFSVGFIANRICSICGEDLSECPHQRDRSYWVKGGPRTNRPCAVCVNDNCNHRPDHLYRAGVVSIIKSGEIREVSLVPRPANPDARLTEIPISTRDLIDHFGDEFVPGLPVSCDKCLSPCGGFDEMSRSESVADEVD